jgi:hypothetical protein
MLYDPEILGTYLKECRSGYNKGTCTPMFIATLFTIAKVWKQPRSPLLMNRLRKCGVLRNLPTDFHSGWTNFYSY